MNPIGNPIKITPWSFSDLEKTEMKKHVRDPLTTLIMAAIFPFFKPGSKVCLSGNKITIEKSSVIVDFGYAKITWEWWDRWYEDNNNLKVFHINTFKACELYDPLNEIVKELFRYAFEGLPAAKEAYIAKPEEKQKAKTSPCDAIDTYLSTISVAIAGQIKFNTDLSEAEKRVKNIWRNEEITLINKQIALMKKNQIDKIEDNSHLENILRTLETKQKLFNQICEEVIAKKLDTTKKEKPKAAPVENLPPPPVENPPPPKEEIAEPEPEPKPAVVAAPVQRKSQTKQGK